MTASWLARWGESARTKNGVPVRELTTSAGIGIADLPAAIERGEIKLYIEGTIAGRHQAVDRACTALSKLKFLVVADTYDSPLAKLAMWSCRYRCARRTGRSPA